METVDDYMGASAIRHLDFMKLDVEGAELDVLRGASTTLDTCRPIILCEISDLRTEPWGYMGRDIYDFLELRNYVWFSVSLDGRLEQCPRKDKFDENLLAVPRDKLAEVSCYVDVK